MKTIYDDGYSKIVIFLSFKFFSTNNISEDLVFIILYLLNVVESVNFLA
jgi:hypothetical protein